jgi:hypothetical protein
MESGIYYLNFYAPPIFNSVLLAQLCLTSAWFAVMEEADMNFIDLKFLWDAKAKFNEIANLWRAIAYV